MRHRLLLWMALVFLSALLLMTGCQDIDGNSEDRPPEDDRSPYTAAQIGEMIDRGELVLRKKDDEHKTCLYLKDGIVLAEHKVLRCDFIPEGLKTIERGEITRVVYRNGPDIIFAATDPQEIEALRRCLVTKSYRLSERRSYFTQKGPSKWEETVRNPMHECDLSLFLYVGEKEVASYSGHEVESYFGDFRNDELGPLLKKVMVKAWNEYRYGAFVADLQHLDAWGCSYGRTCAVAGLALSDECEHYFLSSRCSRPRVKNILSFLRSCQQTNGRMKGYFFQKGAPAPDTSLDPLKGHAIAVLALHQGRLRWETPGVEQLRALCDGALGFLLSQQRVDGGWPAQPDGDKSDLEMTVWAVEAIAAAACRADHDSPSSPAKSATEALEKARPYFMGLAASAPEAESLTCSALIAAGIFCVELDKAKARDAAKSRLLWLAQHPPVVGRDSFLYLCFGAEALVNAQRDEDKKAWRATMGPLTNGECIFSSRGTPEEAWGNVYASLLLRRATLFYSGLFPSDR